MLYKIWSKYGKEHLWAYVDFRMETNALLIDYSLREGIIVSNTCSVSKPIPQEVFDKYGMNYRILQETKSYDEYLSESKPTMQSAYQPIRKISPAQREYLKIKHTPVIKETKNAPAKCDRCLFWDDDLGRCDKMGNCDIK